jgi:hypothetical protein
VILEPCRGLLGFGFLSLSLTTCDGLAAFLALLFAGGELQAARALAGEALHTVATVAVVRAGACALGAVLDKEGLELRPADGGDVVSEVGEDVCVHDVFLSGG